jgi:hypothetical protein
MAREQGMCGTGKSFQEEDIWAELCVRERQNGVHMGIAFSLESWEVTEEF